MVDIKLVYPKRTLYSYVVT